MAPLMIGIGLSVSGGAGGASGGASTVLRGYNPGMSDGGVFFGTTNRSQVQGLVRTFPFQFRYITPIQQLYYPSDTSFTGSIATTTLTVTAWTSGAILPGNPVFGGTTSGTLIVAQLTNTNGSGIANREGTYSVSISQTVSSRAMTSCTTDVLYPQAMRFRHSFNVGGRTVFTGISPRAFVATVDNGASNVLEYDPATWNASSGIKRFDRVDLGVMTDTIDCWMAQVIAASVASPSNSLIAGNAAAENLIQHYGCNKTSTSDLIASGADLTDTTFSTFPATAGGIGTFISPQQYLIEVPGTTKCVLMIGDSHIVGANAGQGAHSDGVTEFGGPLGDALLNVSWADKGVAAQGIGYCKFARGGDGDKNLQYSTNWRYRREGMILTNPTHVANLNNTNDQTFAAAQAATTLAGSASCVRGGAYRNTAAGKDYLCTVAGSVSAGMAEFTAGDTLGTVVVSGSATFICTGTHSAAMASATVVLGIQMLVSDQIKAQWPTLPFIRSGALPQPTTTDSFATAVNQTAEATVGGGLTSKRGTYLGILPTATGKSILRYDFLWRQDALIENDFSTFDGKIIPDAVIANRNQFGGHNTSVGHSLCAPAVTALSLA